ncbi:MAG: hypothetical protein K5866_08580 [Treponema sp.]|nr:hypothetical protein [Treponema sp.]
MKIKRLFLSFLIISILCPGLLFAQESQTSNQNSQEEIEGQTQLKEESPDSEKGADDSQEEEKKDERRFKLFNQDFTLSLESKIYSSPEDFGDFVHSTNFFIELTPGFYLNPYKSELNSGPSAPIYPFSLGFIWPNYTFLAIQPTLTYFSMYHLWYDGNAYPAEIENRTVTTYSIMMDIPIVFSVYMKKNRFQLKTGIAGIFRIGSLANGVSEDDSGYTGSAGGDLKEINKWYWSKLNFLYLSSGFAWLRELTGSLKGGPIINVYFPVGSFISQRAFLGTIISFGVKVSL